jgi:hypothetical protein
VSGQSASLNGLTLSVQAPTRSYTTGQTAPLTITALNTTHRDMTILAPDGALAYVALVRKTRLGPETLKRYPQSSLQVRTPWVLPAGKSREFRMEMTIGPDWPTGEPLSLRAELNGVPGLQAGLTIIVQPAAPAAPAPAATQPK